MGYSRRVNCAERDNQRKSKLIRIKVLHIIDHLGYGGAQKLLQQYFETCLKDKTTALYALRSHPDSVIVAHPNIITDESNSVWSCFALFRLKRYVQKNGVTHLHCHLLRSIFVGYLIKFFFNPRLKLVIHDHGQIFGANHQKSINEGTFQRFAYQFLLRFAKGKVDRVVAVSNAIRKRINEITHIPVEKIVVVSNATSNTPVPIVKRKKTFTVGFCGRIETFKGWDLFIDLVEKLSSRHPDWQFKMAGYGTEFEAAKSRSASIAANISFDMMGYVADINEYYKMLDCLVVTSRFEAFCIVVLEAWSRNIPVVASNVPALDELINHEENGLLFPAGNVDAAAFCVERIATDEALVINIINNSRKSLESYSMDAFAERISKVYDEII